jgi:hypothetical protein
MTEQPPADYQQFGREVVMSFARTNLLAIPFAIASAAFAAVPYIIVWGTGKFAAGLLAFGVWWSILPALAAGIVVHEVLHGVSWALFGRRPFSSIRYGFNVAALTPYAHFTDPLPATAYRIGAAMPGIVLGGLPVVVSLVTGAGWFMGFGGLFLISASGDWLILWMLRGVPSDSLIQDHPSLPGCIVYDTPEDSRSPDRKPS